MELLAPAGSPLALRAALANGADSVYLGGKAFSARQSATNFTLEEIKEALLYAHMRGKKIYLTVNTLMDQYELESSLAYIHELYREGIDALIVQDLGLIALLRSTLPDLPLHASTQMTIHNQEGCRLLLQQGIRRVVLARELSSCDIAQIKESVSEMELEAFVHGALCFSYSGQCLFSSMVGGRSGNRGRCAQPCRMTYSLIDAESRPKILGSQQGQYLLSLSDLSLIDQLPLLREWGVNSLKIEGRMKRPEYVAVVTRVYREALDRLAADPDNYDSRLWQEELNKIFNRTLTHGYLFPDNKGLLSSQRPNNRGILIGRIIDQKADGTARIKLNGPLSEEDGLEVWVRHGKTPAVTVKNLLVDGQPSLAGEAGQVATVKLNGSASVGDRVFKTHDHQLVSRAQQSYSGNDSFRVSLQVEALLEEGRPLSMGFIDQDGFQATVETRSKAQPAGSHPLNRDILWQKLDRLGNTPFKLDSLNIESSGALMVPFSDINAARRQAVETLLGQRKASYDRKNPNIEEYRLRIAQALAINQELNDKTALAVAVSGINEARAAIGAGAQRVYLGLEGLGNSKKISAHTVLEMLYYARNQGCELIPALPQIQKPGELDEWDILVDAGIPAFMAGNLGAVQWCLERGVKVWADYSLNLFNPYSLELLGNMGVDGGCLSPELDWKRLQNFRSNSHVEILVHGRIQLMVSECCIFKQLNEDSNHCQSFCSRGPHLLEDARKYRFPILNDAYCRFHLFNSRTLCLMEHLDQLVKLRPGWLRIEARYCNLRQLPDIISEYLAALAELSTSRRADLKSCRARLTRGYEQEFTRGHFHRGVQ